MAFNLENISQSMTQKVDKLMLSVKGVINTKKSGDVPADMQALLDLVDVIIAKNETSTKELKALKLAIRKQVKSKPSAKVKAKKA